MALAHGVTQDDYYAAIGASYLAWSTRAPWRWLPERMHGWLFDRFGQRMAARFVAEWRSRGK